MADPLDGLERKSVLIMGLGVEGRDVFRFLRARFPDKELAVAETLALDELPAEGRALLEGDPHVRVHLGADHLRHIGEYQVAFRSPGIPLRGRALQEAKARGTELTSQTALFFALCRHRVIGVTGTKGKSTTSVLIHSILSAHAREVHLVGNIGPDLGGVSPLLALTRAGDEALFVYELSSFQLEGLDRSPDVAVMLDVVPEHLDHHGSFEAYLDAKTNITRHQRTRDWFVYDALSATASAVAERSPAQLMPCRIDGPVERGVFIEENYRIVFAAAFGREDIVDVAEVSRALPGRFNLRNVLPAVGVARILSLDNDVIIRGLRGFQPLRDRFENVGTFRGITFYNASIATVPEATIAHLAALAPRVSTVILGGVDRGVDYDALARRLLDDRVATLILFPETGTRLWEAVTKEAAARSRPAPRHIDVTDMETAGREAYVLTPSGSICLHSPAAPSRGGLFKDYADRGAQFRDCVRRLGQQ
ncbi:MAG: UDP-N-acetylmuramoyl-L-alanine--D-glutamate ligase [Candidatus Rokubacteria bacterium]|nr:UDP-N-acetylmuramoyl-L-alanine--D-glutamate ligase [Candidatus Rokubacteria bacterium]